MSREISAPGVPAALKTLPYREPAAWDRIAKATIVFLAAAAMGWSFYSGSLWRSVYLNAQSPLTHTFFWTALVWSLLCYASLVWRLRLWQRYKPMASASDAELPTLSVVIPAYNEGALVRQSIESVLASRYPHEKLQIIVIDDGSTDDTWEHISAAVEEAPDTIDVRSFRQPRNGGKRHALVTGFRHSTGELIVTVDSDTIVDGEALRNAATPFVREPKMGAVAGCVEVLNPRESIYTRFLKCTFTLSFKFVRAYQSEFRGVFCTPGAISAYRASAIRKIADEWATQTFLGMPCTIGEDRAMTNLILREGWLTCYQENARVWSKMPATYWGMTSMLLRWARSNIRETIVLQKFLFKPFRKEHLTAFRFNMMLVLLTLIVPYLLVGNSWILTFSNVAFAGRHAAMIVVYGLTMSAIYYRCERDSDWIWLLVYEFYWIFCLSWIMPYALVSLRNTRWLTRGATGPAGPQRTPRTVRMAPMIEATASGGGSGLIPVTAAAATAVPQAA